MTAGFLIYRAGERSSLEFHDVESCSVWDRKNALAMRILHPVAIEELEGDERLAIVTAGLKAAPGGFEATCQKCGTSSMNATTISDVTMCEACTVQTILLACWAQDLDAEQPDVSMLSNLVGWGSCHSSECAGKSAQVQGRVAFTNAADTQPKCFHCWQQAMFAVQHTYLPELSEEVDRPMWDSLMGRALAAFQPPSAAPQAFGAAQ